MGRRVVERGSFVRRAQVMFGLRSTGGAAEPGRARHASVSRAFPQERRSEPWTRLLSSHLTGSVAPPADRTTDRSAWIPRLEERQCIDTERDAQSAGV